ncbi:MAG: helix-turn-helix domain-containing protein [Gemmataceae bacterium]|nr:helix-turn-helix domain-containing protein [Gemmataceae bacterium]
MTTTLMTEAEAIAYLRLDSAGLRRPDEALRWLRRTGRLKYAKVGRRVRFRREWLDELVERQAARK